MFRIFASVLFIIAVCGTESCLATQDAKLQAGVAPFSQQADSSRIFLPPTAVDSLDVYGALFKTIGILAVLTLILYFALRIYRKSAYGNARPSRAFSARLLGTSIIAPRKSVCVVQVLDHLLVLGLSGDQMNVLLEVPVTQLGDELKKNLLDNKDASQPNFKKALDSLLGNR